MESYKGKEIPLEDLPRLVYLILEATEGTFPFSTLPGRSRNIRRFAKGNLLDRVTKKLNQAPFTVETIKIFLQGLSFKESPGVQIFFEKKFLQIRNKPFKERLKFYQDLLSIAKEKTQESEKAVLLFLLSFAQPLDPEKRGPLPLSEIGENLLKDLTLQDQKETENLLRDWLIHLQTKGIYLKEEGAELYSREGRGKTEVEKLEFPDFLIAVNQKLEREKEKLNSIFKEEILAKIVPKINFLIEEREALISNIKENIWYFLPSRGISCFPPSLAKELGFKKFLILESDKGLFEAVLILRKEEYKVIVDEDGKIIEGLPWWIRTEIWLYLETLLVSFYHDLVVRWEDWAKKEDKKAERVRVEREIKVKKPSPSKWRLPRKISLERRGGIIPEKQAKTVKRPYAFTLEKFYRKLPNGQHPRSFQIERARKEWGIELDPLGNLTLVIPKRFKKEQIPIFSTSAGKLDSFLRGA